MPSWDDIKAFIRTNWGAIVEIFDKIWAFAKKTVLADDSIFAETTTSAAASAESSEG